MGCFIIKVANESTHLGFENKLIFTFAGHKGLKRSDEIWYQTWIFVVNLKIEGNSQKRLIRTLLAPDMTMERVEYTDEKRSSMVG